MMKNSFLRACAVLLLLVNFVSGAAAQAVATDDVVMADTLRSNGKIYVVVAVVVIIVTGLLAYLYLLDRKVSKLEKEVNS